jgi:hypothetical protein
MIANISRHYQQWKQGEKACGLAMYNNTGADGIRLFFDTKYLHHADGPDN